MIWRKGCIHPLLPTILVQNSLRRCAARNLINAVPQPAATTFAFSSVLILLLCLNPACLVQDDHCLAGLYSQVHWGRADDHATTGGDRWKGMLIAEKVLFHHQYWRLSESKSIYPFTEIHLSDQYNAVNIYTKVDPADGEGKYSGLIQLTAGEFFPGWSSWRRVNFI